MITPSDIKKKALRYWEKGNFLSAWCKGEDIFPINIPFAKPAGSALLDNFAEISRGIDLLIKSSKEKTGAGYSVKFQQTNHRSIGKQYLPEMIYIETETDFLFLCGKKKEFRLFKDLYRTTEEELERLVPYIHKKTTVPLKYHELWRKLLAVCNFFLDNPSPGIYIRQIVIPGIDTKFIEAHKKIINELMFFLESEKYNDKLSGISHRSFEKRFGLLYDEPLIRFRILDPEFAVNGISDVSIPLSEFISLDFGIKQIFITENKINGLSFPQVKDSMVIFGLGYGIQILEEILWLQDKKIYYWGDIDTHGFSILSLVRQLLPGCRSLLMDEETLIAHKHAWVREPAAKRFNGILNSLTDDERTLFENLKANNYGKNIRLEQEQIGFDFLLKALEYCRENT